MSKGLKYSTLCILDVSNRNVTSCRVPWCPARMLTPSPLTAIGSSRHMDASCMHIHMQSIQNTLKRLPAPKKPDSMVTGTDFVEAI